MPLQVWNLYSYLTKQLGEYMSADTGVFPETDKIKPESDQEATNVSVAGATVILALGNISSRILGLVREKALTFLFGASAQLDAFQIAEGLTPRAAN